MGAASPIGSGPVANPKPTPATGLSFGGAVTDNQNDPWKPGKRGFVRGAIWTAAILVVAWWFW